VRPLCGRVREQLGGAGNPVAAFRSSGYVARTAERRGGVRI
jgi:L-rhamnose isomerase